MPKPDAALLDRVLIRSTDCLISGLGLFLLIPVFATIAIWIKLDSPGNVFFRQIRVGRKGEHFKMLKFRTMIEGAAQKGPYYTKPGDARVTRFGRFLRRTSLDELPQLMNVFLGEMSLVGPRPDLPVQLSRYTESQLGERLSVRPGLTGWAQITDRHNLTFDQKVKLDLSWSQNISFGGYLKILIKTAKAVVTQPSY